MEIKKIESQRLMVLIALVSSLISNIIVAEIPVHNVHHEVYKMPTAAEIAAEVAAHEKWMALKKEQCPVCYADCLEEKSLDLPSYNYMMIVSSHCGHKVCKDCLSSLIRASVNQNQIPLCPCPSIQRPDDDLCNTPIDDDAIKKATDQHTLNMCHKLKKGQGAKTTEYLPETDETRKIDSFLKDNWFVKRCKYCNNFVVLSDQACKYVKCHCRLGDPNQEICVACGFHTKTKHEMHECHVPGISFQGVSQGHVPGIFYSQEMYAKQDEMIKKFEDYRFAEIEATAHEKKKSE